MKKVCTKCGIERELSEFNKMKGGKFGVNSKCKDCEKKHKAKYYEKNKIKVLLKVKTYREQNVEKVKTTNRLYRKNNLEKVSVLIKEYKLKNKAAISEQGKKYREQNREYIKSRLLKNKEKIKNWQKQYRIENKIKIRAKNANYFYLNRVDILKKKRIYIKNRIERDLNFKLRMSFSAKTRIIINKGYKSASSLKLLGCSIEHARKHLESQFTEGMSWENYGFYGWHIDHLKPCASFDLTDPEQQRECFHYSNLQPLWAKDNLSKGCKIADEYNNDL